jgi:Predicted ATPase of the PP-loop superfamily implicated in cell cycle control
LPPWLAAHGIAGHIEMTPYGPEAHSAKNLRRSACFRCSWLRRKRLFELCAQYGATHLALGHNADDLVQTFFMNLCRNGRVDGMLIRQKLSAKTNWRHCATQRKSRADNC